MQRIIEFIKWSVGVVTALIFLLWFFVDIVPEMYTMIILLFAILFFIFIPIGALFGVFSPFIKKYLEKEKVESKDWLVALIATLIGIWWVFYFGIIEPFLKVVEFLLQPVK